MMIRHVYIQIDTFMFARVFLYLFQTYICTDVHADISMAMFQISISLLMFAFICASVF